MPIDVFRFMNETLPEAFAERAEDIAAIGGRYCFHITGSKSGAWLLNANRPVSVTPGTGLADLTITVDDRDFEKLYDNFQTNATQLFVAGKLRTSGNPLFLQTLGNLFRLAKA